MCGTLLCPSAPAEEGAIILGVVQADGSVSHIKDRIPATREFLDAVGQGREPEQRYRFASPCKECACQQWVDGKCSVPERMQEILADTMASNRLPRCSVRNQCRWYRQSGVEACRVCPWVVTRGGSSADGPGTTVAKG
jgi:hypothetical protein